VLLEKPVALSAGEMEAVLALPSTASSNKLVGFNRRFYGTVASLRNRIAEGGLKAAQIVISEPLDRHIRVHGPALVPHVLAFSSAHTLDLAWHLLGPMAVVRVYAHREVKSAFTCLNGLVETAGGIPVSLAINANDPALAGIRFLFDDHTSWLLAPLETLTVYDRYEITETGLHSAIRRYVPHACRTHEESAEFKPGFVEQMSVFLSGKYGPGARLKDALVIQRFVEALMGTAH
jgi:predicted dehydrogenase